MNRNFSLNDSARFFYLGCGLFYAYGIPNMTVARVAKDKNFTCVSNALIFDKSLSSDAKILMFQMLAVRADKWNVNDE